ncbi:YadA-like family protein [Geotalea sp. SG265]|uniref:YadA family autotransporter adhesin n=1 Tax=Geotalea sp. SG265 TaxID=2922867 RepID=UPI001FAF938C|nr:YadA-like family protein [Geotalea sp. SG265]
MKTLLTVVILAFSTAIAQAETVVTDNQNVYGAGSIAPQTWDSGATSIGYNAQAGSGFLMTQQATAVGMGASATQSFSTAIGGASMATATGATAIGSSSIAAGQNSFSSGYAVTGQGSIGLGSFDISQTNGIISGFNSVGIGRSVTVKGDEAIAIGADAYAGTSGATAIGRGAVSAGAGGVALGTDSNAGANTSVAIATGARVDTLAQSGVAIGNNARVTGNAVNSVAIGAGSVATEANVVEVGNRKITGVASGVNSTDAANVGQLNQLKQIVTGKVDEAVTGLRQEINSGVNGAKKYAAKGIAASLAIPTPEFSNPSATKALAVNVGQYDGEVAIGIGGTYRVSTSVAISGGLSTPIAAGGAVATKIGASFNW